MPYLNSGSEPSPRSLPVAALLLFMSLALLLAAPPAMADTAGNVLRPWLTVGAGNENDLILDPDFNPTVVPGGSFMNTAAGFSYSHALSRTSRLRILNRNSLERFFNDAGRTLAAVSLRSEVRFRGNSSLQPRLSAGGDYFNDSAGPAFRRLGGNLEAGLGFRRPDWLTEASVFYQGRRYPNVAVTQPDLQTDAYTEDQIGAALLLGWQVGPGIFLWGRMTEKSTSAADPDFDSTSWSASGDLDFPLGGDLRFTAGYIHQARTFDNRLPGADTDSYDRIGLGINRTISRKYRLDARYAHSSYTYPQGGDQKTDRFSLAVTVLWGGDRPQSLSPRRTNGLGPAASTADPDLILFRLHAPDAGRVSVSGTFNGWDPDALPLRKTADGWWEARVRIRPGTHEYIYLVDGKPVTPPEAHRTTDDGFGGRNGILEILPLKR